MEQIQKQKQTHKREVEEIEELPAIVDEEALGVSTELMLGKIALVLA